MPLKLLSVLGAAVFSLSAWAGPVAVVSEEEVDLGVIQQGKAVDVPLTLRNTGDAPLVIQRLNFSCHCTSSRPLTEEEKTIPPGGQLALPIRYNPGNFSGQRQAVIGISTNDPVHSFLQVHLKTTVVAPVVMTPAVLRWEPQSKGATLESEIRLKKSMPDIDFELVDIKVPDPDIEFTKTIKQDGDDVVVEAKFHIADNARVGEKSALLEAVVRTGNVQFPVRTQLNLFIMGDAAVRPSQIVSIYRPVEPGKKVSTVQFLWSDPKVPIKLIEARTSPDMVSSIRKMGDRYEVDAFVANDAAPGPHAGHIELFSLSADQPVTSVPIYFVVASPVEADPPYIGIEAGNGSAGTAEIKLTATDSSKVPVSVACDVAGARARLAESSDPKSRQLTVAFDGDASSLPKTGYVTVQISGASPLKIPMVVRGVSDSE